MRFSAILALAALGAGALPGCGTSDPLWKVREDVIKRCDFVPLALPASWENIPMHRAGCLSDWDTAYYDFVRREPIPYVADCMERLGYIFDCDWP